MIKSKAGMMTKSAQFILFSLLLIISMLSGYWFYNNFSWIDEQQEVGFQGLAGTNKLLAAEFFLRKMGVNVQQANGLTAFRDLPSTNTTIVIATQRETINKELNDNLLSWVKSGGHIIVEAKYFQDYKRGKNKNSDHISTRTDDILLKDWSLFAMKSNAEKNNKEFPLRITLNNSSIKKEIEVNFPYEKILTRAKSTPAAAWQVEDDIGSYLIQFPVGQGMITVLTSTAPFYNKYIADYDHALFLHYLVQQPNHDAAVWLIPVDDMPPLWQWLWSNAWYAMFSLSVLFLFWLWRVPFRFGPILNDTQLERRSLLEHIRASGYYRWHNKQSAYLLQQVQNRLWGRIKKMHPSIPYDDQSQAYKMLADITGIKASLIQEVLSKEDKMTGYEFTEKIKLLELIKQHL